MDRRKRLVLVLALLLGLGALVFGQEVVSPSSDDLPKALKEYTETTLVAFARAPSVAAFIEGENRKRVAIQELKRRDAVWQASKTVDAWMWDLMRNGLAWELVNLEYQNKFIVEAFAMNSQGTIVAESNRTSSYWKGEAEKFTAAYADGRGALWYGPVEYDESTGEITLQVSVPVMKGNRAIGAIVFGISLDRWEQRGK